MEKTVDYRKKTFDEFSLMIVYPPPILNSEESGFLSRYYDPSMENQPNEAMSKMV